MADLNIVNVSTIFGRTVAANLTTTTANTLVNTFGSGKTLKVNNILLASKNVSNTGGANVNFVDYSASNTTWPIVADIEVPARATLEVLSKSLYLEEGDRITVNVNNAFFSNNIIVIISYEELA
jgi:hypothetical protein